MSLRYKGFTITMIDRQTWRVLSPEGSVYGWYDTYAAAEIAINTTTKVKRTRRA